MVNPNSDLYRKHPDWAMNFPGRPRTEARNQLLLNLAREDVKEYVFQWLDQLVSDNDIAFLKWDYNRNWSEPGWDAVAPEDQKKIYVAYVRNLYDILDKLRAKHPKLEIESCSGGGGRVDLGILRRTDEVWTSDNTDALDRLTLQDGFTQAYTPGIMMAWVTDVPSGIDGRVVPAQVSFYGGDERFVGVGRKSEQVLAGGHAGGDPICFVLQASSPHGAKGRTLSAHRARGQRSFRHRVCLLGWKSGGALCLPSFAAVRHTFSYRLSARLG